METRKERLDRISKQMGSRHRRKLRKFSKGFTEKFYFFLKCYRSGLLTFCGEDVQVIFDQNGVDCREGFRLYDDGYYKHDNIIKSKQYNILKSVIIGKKSWGLWVNEWSKDISKGYSTKKEILNFFEEMNIIIPESFLKDFENRINEFKLKNYDEYKRINLK